MTVLSVTMADDGSALVKQKFSPPEVWDCLQLSRAITAMQMCCASRRGGLPDNCPCLACEVGKVASRWRRTKYGENR